MGSGVPCLLRPGWGALGQASCSLLLSFSTCEFDSAWLRCRSAEGPSRHSPPHPTLFRGPVCHVPPSPAFRVALCGSLEMGQHSVAGADGRRLSHHFLLGPLPSLMLSGDFPGLPEHQNKVGGGGDSWAREARAEVCVDKTEYTLAWIKIPHSVPTCKEAIAFSDLRDSTREHPTRPQPGL